MLLAPGVAAAQTLEILGPGAGPVPPDGFAIALLKRSPERALLPLKAPQVTADGADLRPGPPSPPLSTYLVVPRPGAREIRIHAADLGTQVDARFPVGPPPSRVELSLEPVAPVKGKDKEAVLRVQVRAPDGSPDPSGSPPLLRANVGTLGAVEPVGPGEFKARYLLPETRYPEVVVIVALEPWPHPQSIHGNFGRLLVPLSTAIEISGSTEPETQYSLELAGGKKFGPVQAGPDGKFKIPVVVAPGYRRGKGLSVDRAGNKLVTKVDLPLPPTDQLACVLNPARLPADGISRARVLCAACDVYGQPVPSASVQLTAARGQVSAPRPVEGGMLEWIYTAPRKLSAEPDVLTAIFRQGGAVSRDELKVEVVQGPVAKAALVPAEGYAHLGGRVPLEVVVEDALDRPRPGASLQLRASAGTVGAATEKAPGRWTASWSAPKEGAGSADLSARAYGPPGADPARIATWIRDGHLFVGVTDLAGLPLSRQPLLVGDRQLVTGDDGSADVGTPAPGRLELSHKQWPGLRLTAYVLDDGQTVYPASAPVGEAVARKSMELYPAVPVNVRIKVDGRSVTYWVEDPGGAILPGRDVRVNLSAGTRSQPTTAEGRTTFKLEGSGPVTVSVADAATWVTAVAEVQR